ncbi:Transcriptional protein swt1 [Smittium culicis]|uniref:Transcriptional protein swt1 n=1 Tax=Smittium culicis TaxID=133412 RepID=A0A1R1X3U5_9FUNG|nr:Transcriptional protein swt1 [Smittium culicis]
MISNQDEESSQITTLVLDTNYLIEYLDFLKTVYKAATSNPKYNTLIIVPFVVLGELDNLNKFAVQRVKKKHASEESLRKAEIEKASNLSLSAKKAIHFLLDCLGTNDGNSFNDKNLGIPGYVPLESFDECLTKGKKVVLRCQKLEETLSGDSQNNDNMILDCCRYFSMKKRHKVGLLTFDKNLQLKARVHEISVIGKFPGTGLQFLEFVEKNFSALNDEAIELALNSPNVINKEKIKNVGKTFQIPDLSKTDLIEPVFFDSPKTQPRTPTASNTSSKKSKRKFAYDSVYIADLNAEDSIPISSGNTYADIMEKKAKLSSGSKKRTNISDEFDTSLDLKPQPQMANIDSDIEMSNNELNYEISKTPRKIANIKPKNAANNKKKSNSDTPLDNHDEQFLISDTLPDSIILDEKNINKSKYSDPEKNLIAYNTPKNSVSDDHLTNLNKKKNCVPEQPSKNPSKKSIVQLKKSQSLDAKILNQTESPNNRSNIKNNSIGKGKDTLLDTSINSKSAGTPKPTPKSDIVNKAKETNSVSSDANSPAVETLATKKAKKKKKKNPVNTPVDGSESNLEPKPLKNVSTENKPSKAGKKKGNKTGSKLDIEFSEDRSVIAKSEIEKILGRPMSNTLKSILKDYVSDLVDELGSKKRPANNNHEIISEKSSHTQVKRLYLKRKRDPNDIGKESIDVKKQRISYYPPINYFKVVSFPRSDYIRL